MTRIVLLSFAALLAALLLTIGLAATAADARKDDHKHHEAFMSCAKACDDCARICDACAAHCAMLVADGKKEHLKTAATCADCATICRAAGSVTARKGPFSDAVCVACAEACKRCGDACDKHRDDDMMRKCTEECRRCEKACRDMLKHVAKAER